VPDIDLLSVASYAGGQPHDQYAWLREHAPVYRHYEPDGPGFWAVTRYDEIDFFPGDRGEAGGSRTCRPYGVDGLELHLRTDHAPGPVPARATTDRPMTGDARQRFPELGAMAAAAPTL